MQLANPSTCTYHVHVYAAVTPSCVCLLVSMLHWQLTTGYGCRSKLLHAYTWTYYPAASPSYGPDDDWGAVCMFAACTSSCSAIQSAVRISANPSESSLLCHGVSEHQSWQTDLVHWWLLRPNLSCTWGDQPPEVQEVFESVPASSSSPWV